MSETKVSYGSKIDHSIYIIRGYRVMLSTDLARLYKVEAKVLIQAVKRNIKRFPPDFMFALEPQEVARSRSQIVTLNNNKLDSPRSQFATLRRGYNIKYPPYAFTEQGVAMLSSVLRSERAIQVNVAIMRVFVKLRETFIVNAELAVKLAELEQKVEGHDENIRKLFDAIRQLMTPPEPPRKQIGFHVREKQAAYGVRIHHPVRKPRTRRSVTS